MELIRGIHNIQAHHSGCVLSIGNFDGVHLGHQKVLKQLCEQAETLGLPSVVMTFEPQPMEFLPLLRQQGSLDYVISLPNYPNARLTAYCVLILIKSLPI